MSYLATLRLFWQTQRNEGAGQIVAATGFAFLTTLLSWSLLGYLKNAFAALVILLIFVSVVLSIAVLSLLAWAPRLNTTYTAGVVPHLRHHLIAFSVVAQWAPTFCLSLLMWLIFQRETGFATDSFFAAWLTAYELSLIEALYRRTGPASLGFLGLLYGLFEAQRLLLGMIATHDGAYSALVVTALLTILLSLPNAWLRFPKRGRRAAMLPERTSKRLDDALTWNIGLLSGLQPIAGAYTPAMKRAIATRDPLRLLPFGIGAGVHWSGYYVFSIFILSMGAAAMVILASAKLVLQHAHLHLAPVWFTAICANLSYCVALLAPGYLLHTQFRAGKALTKLRAEQALLCLAPGVPQGRALNRCIAQSLLKVAAISYAFVVALLALSIPIVRDGAYQHFTEVMMAVPACFVGVALHDYAQMPTIAQQGKWLYYLLYGAGIQLALSASWQRWPIAWVDGPILLCAAMVLMWRWRGIVNAPSCFPAGRASRA